MDKKKLLVELYDRNSKRLWGMLCGMGYNQNDLEDIVQESFLIAFQKMHQLRDLSVFDCWLAKIAINLAKKKARRSNFEILIDNDDFLESELGKERMKEDTLYLKVTLAEEIAKLPDEFKQAFCLNAISDFTYREIADILGVKEGTVKSRIFRAKEILKKNLSEKGNKKGD